MTEWVTTRFAAEPDTLAKISRKTYLQTRNVEKYTDEENGEYWEGESREVSESELKLLTQLDEQSSAIDDVMLAMTELASQIGGE